MDSSSSSSQVKTISQCFIKPQNLPEKSKEPYHLSPLEHIMLSLDYIQKGLLFLKPSISKSDDVAISSSKDFMETLLQKLKDSLASTLGYFYPLVGRLSTSKTDNPISHYVFVDCNNSPGAGFIYAKSDLSVVDIVGSKYVPLVVQSFFDHHKVESRHGHSMSLLSVKVTELVDGVFIGMSMNHSVGDGSSFWQFFNSWSEIFNSREEPINNNKLFSLKNPPIFREVSGPIFRFPFGPLDDESHNSHIENPVLKERMFHFSLDTLALLKSKANQECGTTTISSLQSLSAFIWRSITRARKFPNDQETTCRLAAGSRSRMDPPLPMNHFGVYVSVAVATEKIGDVLEKNVGWAALKLHEAVSGHNGAKIKAFIDTWSSSPSVFEMSRHVDPTLVHMGSSPRFDKYGCEFGMGKAVAARSGYCNKYDGKVSAYPGRVGGGSIDLEVCLLPEFMEALELDHEFLSLVSSSS